jgi:hypothetical protein
MSDGEISQATIRKFKRACAMLNAVVREARETCPGANLYLAEDQMNLMRGPSHDDGYNPYALHENVVCGVHIVGAGGGDW